MSGKERGRDAGWSGATCAVKRNNCFRIADLGDEDANPSEETLDLRKLKVAMIERAWNDLAPSEEIEKKDKRSAIGWFKGYHNPGDYILSWKSCLELLGGELSPSMQRKLNERLKVAEDFASSQQPKERAIRGRIYAEYVPPSEEREEMESFARDMFIEEMDCISV